MQHLYLIIGAGPTGLAMAKALKAAGKPYHQLEADSDVGGNWLHGVYSTTHIISSKKTTEYSDWPMPQEYPDFPSGQQMLEYFRAYAEHFQLRAQIEFNTKVLSVVPVRANQWQAHLSNGEKRTYSGVILCNGHHWKRKFPKFEGQFSGELLHSKDYKHPQQLHGKRVLVVGGGNSASDIISEAARVSASASLSLREGVWFLPKTIMGVPLTDSLLTKAPIWIQRGLIKLSLRFILGDYRNYGLPTPKHKIFEKHPTVSSEVLHYLKHGKIDVRPEIKRLDGQVVEFVDGTRENYDTLICATGFDIDFPFLPKELHRQQGPVIKAYAGCFLSDYKGIYFMAWQQIRGGIGSTLTPATKIMARFIHLQEKLQLPLGEILRRLGFKMPTTHLFDPQKTIREIWLANKFFVIIEWLCKRIDRKSNSFENPELQMTLKEVDPTVY